MDSISDFTKSMLKDQKSNYFSYKKRTVQTKTVTARYMKNRKTVFNPILTKESIKVPYNGKGKVAGDRFELSTLGL